MPSELSEIPDGESKITWLVIFLSVIGLLAANALWLVPSLRDARDSAARVRLEIARRGADSVTAFIDAKIDALQNAADALRFDEASSDIILSRTLKERPEFNTASLVDGDFAEYVRVSRFEILQKGHLRTFSELAAMPKENNAFYLGPVSRSESLEPIIILAVPVQFANGKKPGFIVAELNLKSLSEVVTRFRFGATGKVYIFDQSGTLIIDPDLSLVLKRPFLGERAIVHTLIAGQESVDEGTYQNENKIPVVASGIFLPQFNWGVISEQHASEAGALRDRIILLAVISVLVGFLLLGTLLANARKLVWANVRLRDLLRENYENAKMLIRRDLELGIANESLEQADKVKSDFITIAAHQLRNPLTNIRWSYQMVLEKHAGRLDDEEKLLLDGGLQASVHMIGLVDDLLNIARIEEGQSGFNRTPQSLTPILDRLAAQYQKIALEKKIRFSVNLPVQPLPAALLDGEKIAIAFENVLDNAMKYTKSDGEVTLRASCGEDKIKITVQDSGIGIPKDQLHRVFSKFFRAPNAMLFDTSGSGLGLYVASNVIEKHHGTIGVESMEGKGSIFTITLPCVTPAKAT